MTARRIWLLAGALVLAGCVSVPTSGPVVEGRAAGDPVPPPNVAVLATGPREGDSPVAIVDGFLAAMSSYEPGYATARQFLTPEAAAQWRPESGIAVYGAGEGSRTVSETEDGVTISLALVSRVEEDGSSSAVEEGSRLVLDLAVEQVGGQWRIATPPDGLVMTAFDFTREFASFASYFFDPAYDVLVPDLTYLPVRGNLPTLLVEELLDGPTAWLEPAVRSALGPGVGLATGTVVQAGTLARVDLTAQVRTTSAAQRDRLAAQLAWTLRQAPGVAEVQVLADGQPLPLPRSQTGIVSADQYASYDPAEVPAGDELFAVADGRVVAVDDEQADPVPGPLGQPGGYRSAAVSRNGLEAIAVSEDGSTLTRGRLAAGAEAQTLELGSDLGVPSYDRENRVWLVDRGTTSSRVLLLEEEPDPVRISAGLLEQVRVERLILAPDGVRAAAVYQTESGPRLLLALVLVRPDGTLELGQPRDLPLEQVDPVDVAWASATALALLASDEGDPQPYLVELSNAALSSRGEVSGAQSLTVSPGQPLVVGTGPVAVEGFDEPQPVVLRQDALQEWVPLVPGRAPTYPG